MSNEQETRCYFTFETIDAYDYVVLDYVNIDISKSKIISIIKGDTSNFNLKVTIGNRLNRVPYKLVDDDVVKFIVTYPNTELDFGIISKEYTKDDLNEDNSVTIKFSSEDTLWLNEGVYYYTIKLYKSNGEVITLQQRTKFILMN